MSKMKRAQSQLSEKYKVCGQTTKIEGTAAERSQLITSGRCQQPVADIKDGRGSNLLLRCNQVLPSYRTID